MKARLYPASMKCNKCHHTMRYHNKFGCMLQHCVCLVENRTMDMFINNTIGNYKRVKAY